MTLRRIAAICLIFALLPAIAPGSALAEGCFIIEVDSLDMGMVGKNDYVSGRLTSGAQGVRIIKYLGDPSALVNVRLTLTQKDSGRVVFDRNYGGVGGWFDSGDIYLPFVDNRSIPYLVTLYLDSWVYAFPFIQLQPRMTDNTGCTFGLRLNDIAYGLPDSWMMGSMLDIDELRLSGHASVPLCAGNLYIVGNAHVSLSGDTLSVSLSFHDSANVSVSSYSIYCMLSVNELVTSDPARMPQRRYSENEGMDVSGASTALLYIPMSLSYDPAGLARFSYDLWGDWSLKRQYSLMEKNLAAQAMNETPYIDVMLTPDPNIWAITTPEPYYEPTPEPFEYITPEPFEYMTPEPFEYITPEPSEYIAPEQTPEPTAEPTAVPAPEPAPEVPPELSPEPTVEAQPEIMPEAMRESVPEQTAEPAPAS